MNQGLAVIEDMAALRTALRSGKAGAGVKEVRGRVQRQH